jgi:stage III sporulation protein AB
MWIKLLGSVLTIAATSWIGLEIANQFRIRPLYLRQIQSCLQMLETEINYGLTPLPRALEKIAAIHQGTVGEFFRAVHQNLTSIPGTTVREAWDKSLAKLVTPLYLTSTDYHILVNFGMTLGVSDRADQVKHLKLVMAQMASAEDQAWEAKEKNERMYKSLGFLSGMAVVILLY